MQSTPGKPSERAQRVVLRLVGPLVSVAFRPTLRGVEHLPEDGRFLLIANHSAGMGQAEIASFAFLYLKEVGPDRPLAGFAHFALFKVWPFEGWLRALGAVPSTYEDAEETLAQGVPLLIFPGGDHETLRPVWQANRVTFGGRKGFLRIARKAGIPIVPMGIRGSHYTAPMLVRSKLLSMLFILPRALGITRWGLSLLGVVGAPLFFLLPIHWTVQALLIWLWLCSPFVFLPIIPWTLRFRIGPALSPEELFADDDLEAALERVEGAVQDLVD